MNNTPDLLDVVNTCTAKLAARQLRFAPQPADLPMNAETMTEDLVRANCVKHIPVIEAFDYIGRTETDWPQPAKVISVYRLLAKQRAMNEPLPALEGPQVSKKIAEQNLVKLREMASNIINNGQRKHTFKYFDQDKHIKSENGTMPLTDDQWLELQRVFIEAKKAHPGKNRAGLIAQDEYLKSINYGYTGEEYDRSQ